MKPAEIFLRSANISPNLHETLRARLDKARWSGMAERWLRNAELFERKSKLREHLRSPI